MSTIVLAYSSGAASATTLEWLARARRAPVVTVTLDVGQGADLAAVRARALSGGAIRAHAVDARDELARDFLLPSIPAMPGVGRGPSIESVTLPLIARKLVEIARIEGAHTVAHGSAGTGIDERIRAIDPAMNIVAPLRDAPAGAPLDSAAALHLPCRIEQNLWGRMVSWQEGEGVPREARPALASSERAQLDIRFERGIPVALNDVEMPPVDLLESLSLIAGRHAIGRREVQRGGRRVVYDAPAAAVLQAARTVLGDQNGIVRLAVLNSLCTVLAPHDAESEMVTRA